MATQRFCPWPAKGLELAIAQVKFACGEACGERQEACHGVGLAVGVDQGVAQDHEATALAIDQRL